MVLSEYACKYHTLLISIYHNLTMHNQSSYIYNLYSMFWVSTL